MTDDSDVEDYADCLAGEVSSGGYHEVVGYLVYCSFDFVGFMALPLKGADEVEDFV